MHDNDNILENICPSSAWKQVYMAHVHIWVFSKWKLAPAIRNKIKNEKVTLSNYTYSQVPLVKIEAKK